MGQKKRVTRVVSLGTMMALSLVALTAAMAQASEFKVGGTLLSKPETWAGSGGAGKLLVAGLGLTIECSSSTASGTIENKLGAGVAAAEVFFTGCQVAGNKFCVIYPSAADAKAKTNAGKIPVHGTSKVQPERRATGLGIVIVEEGMHFGTFYFSGAGCTLPSSIEVHGTVGFELPNVEKESVNQTIEVEELTGELFYGSEKATVDGGAITDAHLTGANAGKTWSVE